jgi:hypothetical protein
LAQVDDKILPHFTCVWVLSLKLRRYSFFQDFQNHYIITIPPNYTVPFPPIFPVIRTSQSTKYNFQVLATTCLI